MVARFRLSRDFKASARFSIRNQLNAAGMSVAIAETPKNTNGFKVYRPATARSC
ncbi:Uncharacterised protein [Mycobacteroides abscessus subsp. abscessus]|nr:Uncharacterised protein [Mycobacteroides abscessus subsp. abscessus]